MIPIRLREELNLTIGKEYTFYIHEDNGRKYVCIDCGDALPELSPEELQQIAQKSGMKIVPVDD